MYSQPILLREVSSNSLYHEDTQSQEQSHKTTGRLEVSLEKAARAAEMMVSIKVGWRGGADAKVLFPIGS